MKTKTKKIGGGVARPAAPQSKSTAARSGVISSEVVPALRLKSILVPIDFSDLSKQALDYAVPFAQQFGARLTLLHVFEPVAASAFPALARLVLENDKVVAACKTELDRLVKEKGIPPKLVEKALIRVGRSYVEIADAARTLKVDLIIISTHGYTGLKHTFLGSTTERVVRHAPCPVLVVRENQHEFVNAQTPQAGG